MQCEGMPRHTPRVIGFIYCLESKAKVWLITNVSEPVVSSSDDARSPGPTNPGSRFGR